MHQGAERAVRRAGGGKPAARGNRYPRKPGIVCYYSIVASYSHKYIRRSPAVGAAARVAADGMDRQKRHAAVLVCIELALLNEI